MFQGYSCESDILFFLMEGNLKFTTTDSPLNPTISSVDICKLLQYTLKTAVHTENLVSDKLFL